MARARNHHGGSSWTVLRAHSREVLYSEAIQEFSEAAGLVDVRPRKLSLRFTNDGGGVRKLDRWLVRVSHDDRLPHPYMGWGVALSLFIVADISVFIAV